jgi:hypothetical protein
MERLRVSQLTGMSHYAHRRSPDNPMSRPRNWIVSARRK